MTTLKFTRNLIIAMLLFTGFSAVAQDGSNAKKTKPVMKTYLIERDIPNAGQLTAEQLKGISQKSCSVLKEMGHGIQWIQSYVTDNKIYCVYKAESEELIREHGAKGGFPVTAITEIDNIISPATAK